MVKDEIMMKISKDIIAEIQHQLVSEGLVYTRQLFESWEIEVQPDGSIIIGSSLVYAKIANDGRLPGKMPPVDVLFKWVSDKVGAESSEEARSIAWAVAKKIEREGTEPRHYIEKALFKMEVG